jgi:glycine hydroxymethyltransferase
VFTNKYAEGYPDARYYNGCENMDAIELYAISQLKKLFGVNFANVQPHSGANANLAVMHAFLKPGDKIVGMDLASGGHLSHGAKVNVSGKVFDSFNYGVDKDGFLDYGKMHDLVDSVKPKMLIVGASAYPRQIQWSEFRKAADRIGDCIVLADIAHYAGLIAGGAYYGPEHNADVITSTTHKTLRGPRGGVIMWNNPDFSRKINSGVFPGTQGGPLMNQIAAKAQCFSEALDPDFKEYAHAVVCFSRAMSDVFLNEGIPIQTGGTDSHIILINLISLSLSGKKIADELEKIGITVNKNGVPNDPLSFKETSGIRIGTAAETSRPKVDHLEWFRDLALTISNVIYDNFHQLKTQI